MRRTGASTLIGEEEVGHGTSWRRMAAWRKLARRGWSRWRRPRGRSGSFGGIPSDGKKVLATALPPIQAAACFEVSKKLALDQYL